MFQFSDNRKIGMILMAVGLLFMGLGVMFFFDRALLALGNISFLASFPFLIGVRNSLNLFNPMARGAKWKGIVAFVGGVLLVLVGWPFTGICVEAYGAFKMFGGILPRIVGVLSALPIAGRFFQIPFVANLLSKLSQAAGSSKPASGVV